MKERYQQLKELFQLALERPANERSAFLDKACNGDASLQAELEELIAAHEQAGYLDAPASASNGSLTDHPVETMEGRRIGAYKILRELGHGGMGAVYLAVRDDDQFKKQVAIKLVRGGQLQQMASNDLIVRRFRQERQILASLEHPNIARLLDGGATAEGHPYLVLEYVEGQSLDRYCDGQQLSLPERLRLFRTVCAAVHYAHQNLVVHRDLKPSNILITLSQKGNAAVPKLLDFGIAKILGVGTGSQPIEQTLSSVRLMTPAYASPEQVRGEIITTASDVYALGVVLYELLTGHRPYQVSTNSLHEAARIICEVEPAKPSAIVTRAEVVTDSNGNEKTTITPKQVGDARKEPPEKLRRWLAGDLDNIVLMALRKEPQRRYASVEQFSEDIQRYLDGLPVRASRDTFAYRSAKFVRRHRTGVVTVTALLLMIVFSVLSLIAQAERITRERDRAVAAEHIAAQQRDQAERAGAAEKAQRQQAEVNLLRALEAERLATSATAQATSEAARANAEARRANEETQHARTETERAQLEANTSNEVKDFMVRLFAESDPNQMKGNKVSALEILDKGAAQLGERLKDQPAVQAPIMHHIGLIYYKLGLYDKAVSSLSEAVRLRRETLHQEDHNTAQSLSALGVALQDKGDLAAAEKALRQSVEIGRKLPGEQHRTLAVSLNNLAYLLKQKNDFTAAEALYREALALHRERTDNDRREQDIGQILNNLGDLVSAKGNYAAAEPLYRESAERLQREFGHDNLSVATVLSNLGTVLARKGDYAAAEPFLREALAIQRKLVGNEHPSTALSLTNLGTLLGYKGDYDGALQLHREALQANRKRLGNDHPVTAIMLGNIANNLQSKGDYKAAEAHYREELDILIKRVGRENTFTAIAMHNLATCLQDQKDFAAAESVFAEAIGIRRKILPASHPDLALSLAALGQLLIDKDQPQRAETLLREALEIRRKALPKGNLQTAITENVLGECLTTLQHFAEAEPLLIESYAVIKTGTGEQDKRRTKALNRLVTLYEKWGKADQAAYFRTLSPH